MGLYVHGKPYIFRFMNECSPMKGSQRKDCMVPILLLLFPFPTVIAPTGEVSHHLPNGAELVRR
jgi:hypothetical protein